MSPERRAFITEFVRESRHRQGLGDKLDPTILRRVGRLVTSRRRRHVETDQHQAERRSA